MPFLARKLLFLLPMAHPQGVKQQWGLIEMTIIEHTHTGCSIAAADVTPFWISFLLLTELLFPLPCVSVLRALLLITGSRSLAMR